MAITSANQLELLQTAEAVAREKMIDPDLVIQAMEDSLARAAKSRYGAEMDIRVKIDRRTGRAGFTRVRTVVDEEELENYQAQFTADQAKPYFETQKDAEGRQELLYVGLRLGNTLAQRLLPSPALINEESCA